MFDYIYGDKCSRFSFIRLPQILFTDERFRSLSSDTKILYALLLDRTGLSIKKHWLDEQGRVYISFPILEIAAKLGIGKQKAGKLLRELENFGLIERERLGLGKPDKIYVKNCGKENECDDSDDENIVESHAENETSEVPISPFQKAENQFSGDVKNNTQEIPKSSFPQYNSQTELFRLNQSDHIDPDSRRNDRNDYTAQREVYESIIKQNIEYDWFADVFQLPMNDPNRPYGSIEQLDNIVNIILDCVCSNSDRIRVNGSEQCTSVVRSRFLKLDAEHIQYVLKCLSKCESTVKNIRAYLITVLYNATMTMETAFEIEFNSTFYRGKG